MKPKLVLGLALILAGCGGSTDSDGKGSTGGAGAGGSSASGGSGGGSTGGNSGSGGEGASSWCGPLPGDPTCGSNEYCNLLNCSVSNSEGFCIAKPQGCPEDCPGVCGCDGKFYCNACSAQSAGVDVSDGLECFSLDGGTKTCGGLTGALCGPGEFCQYSDSCGAGDIGGVCKQKPTACDADCPGVCGCDGNFYCSECAANAAGISVSNDKACLSTGDGGVGTGCSSNDQCKKGLLCCYPCGVQGCDNQCMPPDPSTGGCPLFQ